MPIRVLIIDDSPIVRQALKEGLELDNEIQVVGTAVDPYMAREKIAHLRPDVLTLDIEMPRMNGVQFLRFLMPQFPLPVIVVSAITHNGSKATIAALEAGAIDFVTKPGSSSERGLESVIHELRTKVKIAAMADVSHWKQKPAHPHKTVEPSAETFTRSKRKIVAIGASTGGVNAVSDILPNLPESFPAVLIVQHMPPGFTRSYAERLNTLCKISVKEAEHGDPVLPGRALIAPGEKQMYLKKDGASFFVACQPGDKVKGHCPSVDVLFRSVAKLAGPASIGLILTGMGSDGAQALLEMRQNGARTFAQDAKSSVVFGMPQEAFKIGGAERLIPLQEIPDTLINTIRER